MILYVLDTDHLSLAQRGHQRVTARLSAIHSGTKEIETISMNFTIEFEQEEDGRWLAEVIDLPGVIVYGQTREEAAARVQALALRVVADRLEHGESAPQMVSISFIAA